MKDKKKNKESFDGKKFLEGINFWQKQILELGNLKSILKRNKAELKKIPQKIRSQLDAHTVTERIINKQLRNEIEQRKQIERVIQDAFEYYRDIVDTVREPLLILGADLKVISANRSFYRSFKVKPEDTDKQYIYDLGDRQWNIPKLRELLEDILPKTTSFDNFEVEHDFPGLGKRIMLLNARKIYRKLNHAKLILLSIDDITEFKNIESGLEKTRKELEVIKQSADEACEFAESIINTVREPLISLDKDLRVVMASKSFYELFKLKPEETVGQFIYDLGNKQWDIPKLRELLGTIIPKKTTFDNYKVEYDFPDLSKRIMLLNARQIRRARGKERSILLAIEDITERKERENRSALEAREIDV